LVFIDGHHTYEGCRDDLRNYSTLLNVGGFLVMHDYNANHCPGVKRATDEFLAEGSEYQPLYLMNSMLVLRRNSQENQHPFGNPSEMGEAT